MPHWKVYVFIKSTQWHGINHMMFKCQSVDPYAFKTWFNMNIGGGLQIYLLTLSQYNHRARVNMQLLWVDTAKINKALHIMSETIPWVGESDV